GGGGGFPVGTGLTGTVIRPGDFEVLVRAVESENRGKTIALPRQLVANNATASLRSVSRQPFTSINASDTVATTSFGGTEDAGVTLTLTPLIAAGDHLNLEYAIELSAFTGESTTVEGGGVIPPPSQQNSLQGQVTLPDGFTVVLGGLNSITDGVTQTRVPVLGSIPVLGALFGTQSDSTTESRFYVFVRANVMRHETFEDLRLLTAPDLRAADLDSNEPTLTPLWID
ncbi:MAG: type II and III secretion system protein, partial [Phycisphaerales bacterium]|nr:type II and III secretion system protein [Phycisphaerales bacterium]